MPIFLISINYRIIIKFTHLNSMQTWVHKRINESRLGHLNRDDWLVTFFYFYAMKLCSNSLQRKCHSTKNRHPSLRPQSVTFRKGTNKVWEFTGAFRDFYSRSWWMSFCEIIVTFQVLSTDITLRMPHAFSKVWDCKTRSCLKVAKIPPRFAQLFCLVESCVYSLLKYCTMVIEKCIG